MTDELDGICRSCGEEFILSSGNGLCPNCNLMVCLFGEPQEDGTRSKGVLNHS